MRNWREKETQNAERVVSEHEKHMIRKATYSGPRVVDSGEYLPHPPKKK